MNIIKKFLSFIKNIFNGQKKLEAHSQVIVKNDKAEFTKSLKVTNSNRKEKKKIETLICDGDGLGIQNKISY